MYTYRQKLILELKWYRNNGYQLAVKLNQNTAILEEEVVRLNGHLPDFKSWRATPPSLCAETAKIIQDKGLTLPNQLTAFR